MPVELTDRQLEVLVYLANGWNQDEIARDQFISVNAVHRHIAEARKRLNARSTTHLIALAVSSGLIQIDSGSVAVS